MALWASFIFYMSSRTSESLQIDKDGIGAISVWFHNLVSNVFNVDPSFGDVIAHTTEYTILGALLVNALIFHIKEQRAVGLAFTACIFYAFSDELHQLFFSAGRTFQLQDLVCDTLGALLGIAIVMCILKLVKKR